METESLNIHWLEEFKEKGFFIWNEPEILELIGPLDDSILLNKEERLRDNGEKDLPPDVAKKFFITAQFLKFKYLEKNWPNSEYKKFIVWDGVDKDNQHWHTDIFEDMNLFFLFYFDDTFPETGGGINFKWNDQYFKHQPKKGDLILVSNKRGFFHRADSTTIQRRVASFDFLYTGDVE